MYESRAWRTGIAPVAMRPCHCAWLLSEIGTEWRAGTGIVCVVEGKDERLGLRCSNAALKPG